jgi:uncharacterized OB-fold protein
MAADVLTAPYVLKYGYRRSVGPVTGRFLAALREGRIEGARTKAGRVIVPPSEYDPDSGEPISELVPVSGSGTVTTWSWVAEPRRLHPLKRPFAWALIRLDGADTAMLHAVDAGEPSRMKTGMRVRARFLDKSERKGELRDLTCFEIDDGKREVASEATESTIGSGGEPVKGFVAPVHLEYTINAGRASSRFLRGLVEGRLLGQRCPVCKKVNLPPRGACPTCGVPTEEEVEVAHTGTVTTFCVINIQFDAQARKLPYACASILLDGADTTLFHLIQDVSVEQIRMGMRVRAVWAKERGPSLEAIEHFAPLDEPDAPFDSYKEHLA